MDANLYGKCYTRLLNSAIIWLQLAVMDFDVFSYRMDINMGNISFTVCDYTSDAKGSGSSISP